MNFLFSWNNKITWANIRERRSIFFREMTYFNIKYVSIYWTYKIWFRNFSFKHVKFLKLIKYSRISFINSSRFVTKTLSIQLLRWSSSLFVLEWPSNWIEPELGRLILGLGRIEHRFFARRIESNASVLFARIERIRVIVRRIELNLVFCSNDLNELKCMFDDLNRTYSFVRCSNSSLACSS